MHLVYDPSAYVSDNRMHRAYSTYPQTYPDQARIDKPAPMRPVDISVRLLSSVCSVSLWITSVGLCLSMYAQRVPACTPTLAQSKPMFTCATP